MTSTDMDSRSAVGSSDRGQQVGRRNGLAGACGLVFLALIAFQNVLRAVVGPATNASDADLAQLAHADSWSVHLMLVTYAIGFPALFVFAAGLSSWCSRTEPRSTMWAGLGQASTAVVAVLFGLVNVLQVTMVAARDQLDAAPDVRQLVWTMHNAVFTVNLIAIGLALLALGRAAVQSRLVPTWMGPVTAVGGGLLFASALPAVAVVQGSAWMAVGLLGFLIWMAFLAVAGIALLAPGKSETSPGGIAQ